MIKAIVFDLRETLGTKNISISKSLQQKFNIEKTSDFMHLYESAAQLKKWNSEEEMATNFLQSFNIEVNKENIEYIVKLFREGIEKANMFDGMKDMLITLRKNYKLGFISNTTFFESIILDKWKIKHLFDVTSFSCEIGFKKPSKEIFDITLQNLDIDPQEAVFIDDGEKNILKAKEIGLQGIMFNSAEQVKKDLQKIGVIL